MWPPLAVPGSARAAGRRSEGGWHTRETSPTDCSARAAQARAAESSGFNAVLVMEHFYSLPRIVELAGSTSRELGVAVDAQNLMTACPGLFVEFLGSSGPLGRMFDPRSPSAAGRASAPDRGTGPP